ncbi:hypothetical protein P5673_015416 [Acropora cervicornis]|uniref:DDE Tnp4 domain-containing protein n=1 Tax=Acropora cervicornis TaxID=6130 RepID=A0AAD9QHN1_ACRCE|nr:hypothetical protein P5673_015416 [Acropora cervicornis]
MSESSTQNRGVEYMFWRPKHASFDREDMRNNGKDFSILADYHGHQSETLAINLLARMRGNMAKYAPMLSVLFGKRTTVITDGFEVFTERPTNLLARAQTFSSYKHHNTVKSYQRSLTERSQLDPIDMENTRGIANVRIHLKRVIGLLQKKLTTDVLMSNKEQQKVPLAVVL